jgi:hypothetical protein
MTEILVNGELTALQLKTLELICRGNPGEQGMDAVIDLDQLLDRLAIEFRATTKSSMQFLIRVLVARGLIEKRDVGKRRSYKRVGYIATRKGSIIAAPKPQLPVFHEPEASPYDGILTDGVQT